MKKITIILMIIILLVTLTSCEDNVYVRLFDKLFGEVPEHRELFNELYDNNFKAAEEVADRTMSHYDGYDFYVVERSKITKGSIYENFLQYGAFEYEGIDRVIISQLRSYDYIGLDIIEFESVEYAEKMMAEANPANAHFARYENIVYNLRPFGPVFIYGEIDYGGAYIYNSNKNILYEVPGSRYKAEKLEIQDCVKYIVENAIIYNNYIKEIICGEELEKIGNYAMFANENLEFFVTNEKLKVINFGALSRNPKLKTVKLNDGLEYIGEQAFYGCPSLEYVVVPESVKYIKSLAFTSGILYCEIESKPEGWDNDFVTDNVKVYWGNEWEYNEEGIPVLIEE